MAFNMKRTASILILAALSVLLGCAPRPDEYLMAKQYSYRELKNGICAAQRKNCVELEDELYFIDQDFLFRFDKRTEVKEYVDGFDVKEVVGYKGLLVGLQHDGDIYLLTEDDEGERSWFELGSRAANIEANDSDLIALTYNGSVWAYMGEPGPVRITYIPITTVYNCGSGFMCTMVTMIPSINGREVAFEETSFSDVYAIDKVGSDLVIELQDGRTHLFSRFH